MAMNKYTDFDNVVQEQRGDDGAASIITSKHWHIHNGEHFHGSKRSLALANAGTMIVHLRSGSAKHLHANVEVICGGKCTIDAYIGSTYTADGTAVPIFNNSNKANAKTTGAQAFVTPTGPSYGTAIYEGIGLANMVDTLGVNNPYTEKILAKGGTDICVVITNTSGGAADFGVNFDFYEEG